MVPTIDSQVEAEFDEQWLLATDLIDQPSYRSVVEELGPEYVQDLFKQHEENPIHYSTKSVAYEIASKYAIEKNLIQPVGWGD